MTVPMPVSPGRSGFGPQLALSYDSGAGNGVFGFGWSLSLPVDHPQDRQGPAAVPRRRGVGRLRPLRRRGPGAGPRAAAEPRSRTVGAATYRIQRYRPRDRRARSRGSSAGPTRRPARSTGARSRATTSRRCTARTTTRGSPTRPTHPPRIFSWLICESYDDKGNAIVYDVQAGGRDRRRPRAGERAQPRRATGEPLPEAIRYGNRVSRAGSQPRPRAARRSGCSRSSSTTASTTHDDPTAAAIAGDWLCRHDPFSSYRAGFEVRTYRLCQRVLMFHHFPDEAGRRRRLPGALARLRLQSSRGVADDVRRGQSRSRRCIASITQTGLPAQARAGDGLRAQRRCRRSSSSTPRRSSTTRCATSTRRAWRTCPAGSTASRTSGSTWTARASPASSPSRPAPGSTSRTSASGRFGAGRDASRRGRRPRSLGDGRRAAARPGRRRPARPRRARRPDARLLRARRATATGAPFRPFDSLPNLDWHDPNLRFVDLDGDGHADVLITEDDALHLAPVAGRGRLRPGASACRRRSTRRPGRACVFADGTQSIYLADMSGDGLTDLVRIRNGEVCYWPNLGYGRFGAKVDDGQRAAGSTARTSSTSARIRLADIDGSGTTDIIYLRPRRRAPLLQPVGQRLERSRGARRRSRASTTSPSVIVDRPARQRHRLPGLVVAAARRRAAGRCATST